MCKALMNTMAFIAVALIPLLATADDRFDIYLEETNNRDSDYEDLIPVDEDPAGQIGLFFQTGLLFTRGLTIENLTRSQSGMGLPFNGGVYYFINKNLISGIDLAWTYYPEWFHLWGCHENWSSVEFGAHIKCLTHSYKPSLYFKAGLKFTRLYGSRTPGQGLFGGISGTPLKTNTAFAQGGELAVGIMGTPSAKGAVYIELFIGHQYTKDKDVTANGETADWKYPFDLVTYGLRVGGIVPFTDKQ